MTPTMLADRSVIRITGLETADFLQGLVTNDIAGLDRPRWAGLLTPQGKTLFDIILWPDGRDVLIDCESGRADALCQHLSKYRLRRAVAITVDSALAVHWHPGGDRGEPDPRLAALGRRWLGPPGPAAQGWRGHRLSMGVTEGVDELGDGQILWLECNGRELNGTSFTKGCYVGQENTARMYHRDKATRRLVVAPLRDTEPRAMARYPELAIMVTLRRVDDLADAYVPEWLNAVISAGS